MKKILITAILLLIPSLTFAIDFRTANFEWVVTSGDASLLGGYALTCGGDTEFFYDPQSMSVAVKDIIHGAGDYTCVVSGFAKDLTTVITTSNDLVIRRQGKDVQIISE